MIQQKNNMGKNLSYSVLQPPLRWLGGKRWLLSHDLFRIPKCYCKYFEPFLGGGAIFFGLQPSQSLLSDSNPELINCYIQIRDNWKTVLDELYEYIERHSQSFYYQTRFQVPQLKAARAARLIYLNQTCFNGIYRVNRRGEFNVPMGDRLPEPLNIAYLQKLSAILGKAQLEVSDFETSINQVGVGDFLYSDPPYTVMHNHNGFRQYNNSIFNWADQVRLAKSIRAASDRGAYVAVTNANHESIVDLYANAGFVLRNISRKSTLSGRSAARGSSSELLITNY